MRSEELQLASKEDGSLDEYRPPGWSKSGPDIALGKWDNLGGLT
ncbi:hypothetical protein QY97_03119 [Bacillus thermotolerans]|uniref:Uncharacterized protein n=1 Tax=Bacillus thermotolerans TaxID=1221996 RepID=A0A0F5I9M3_BACTR|nr:hypothetical protein QY97_03119 [Bacillus thermotolerans]KKB41882.1 hypothetical protein QY95_00500 [Bacillus thermotolerans]KKB44406.1 hypothetical protein QY96_03006 [Bacillus thermotolerans]